MWDAVDPREMLPPIRKVQPELPVKRSGVARSLVLSFLAVECRGGHVSHSSAPHTIDDVSTARATRDAHSREPGGDDRSIVQLLVAPVTREAYCKQSGADGAFGGAVALTEKVLLIGAPMSGYEVPDERGGSRIETPGAAFVYSRGASDEVILRAILQGTQAGAKEWGACVAASGEIIAIGSPVAGVWVGKVTDSGVSRVRAIEEPGFETGCPMRLARVGDELRLAYSVTQLATKRSYLRVMDVFGGRVLLNIPIPSRPVDLVLDRHGAAVVTLRDLIDVRLGSAEVTERHAVADWPGGRAFTGLVRANGRLVVSGYADGNVRPYLVRLFTGMSQEAPSSTRAAWAFAGENHPGRPWHGSVTGEFGGCVAVYAEEEPDAPPHSGVEYVFDGSAPSNARADRVVPASRRSGQRFGASVAAAGDVWAFGSPAVSGPGAVYLFRRIGRAGGCKAALWDEVARIDGVCESGH
jgi:hypothetical protein